MSATDKFIGGLFRFRNWCMKGRVRTRVFVLFWLLLALSFGFAQTLWLCAQACYEAATDEAIWPRFGNRCREAWQVFVTGKFNEPKRACAVARQGNDNNTPPGSVA